MYKSQVKESGFAAVEAVLLVIIIAVIAGVTGFVFHQKNEANKTLTVTSTAPAAAINTNTTPAVSDGSTTSIDTLLQQDANTETNADTTGDTQIQQDAASTNPSLNNLSGAYDENNL